MNEFAITNPGKTAIFKTKCQCTANFSSTDNAATAKMAGPTGLKHQKYLKI
jgi:hypothetical protein